MHVTAINIKAYKILLSSFSAIYILGSMAQTCLSLLLTIWIVSIFHHFPVQPVPGCVRGLVLNCLARVLCLYQESSKDNNQNDFDQAKTDHHGYGFSPYHLMLPRISKESWQRRRITDSLPSQTKDQGRDGEMSPQLAAYFRYRAERYYGDRREDQLKEDWKLVARVLDRLFAWFMLLVFFAEIGLFMYFALR